MNEKEFHTLDTSYTSSKSLSKESTGGKDYL